MVYKWMKTMDIKGESRKIFAKNKKSKVSNTEKHGENHNFAYNCAKNGIHPSARKIQRLTTKNTEKKAEVTEIHGQPDRVTLMKPINTDLLPFGIVAPTSSSN